MLFRSVIAAAGPKRRELTGELPRDFNLPTGFSAPHFVQKGILAITAPKFINYTEGVSQVENLCKRLENKDLDGIPLILLVDDAAFTAETVNNFVWTTFTRANPSHDMHGIGATTVFKHWGCQTLVIDELVASSGAYQLYSTYEK